MSVEGGLIESGSACGFFLGVSQRAIRLRLSLTSSLVGPFDSEESVPWRQSEISPPLVLEQPELAIRAAKASACQSARADERRGSQGTCRQARGIGSDSEIGQ